MPSEVEFSPTVELLGKLGEFESVAGPDPVTLVVPWIGRTLLLPGYGPHTRKFMTKMVNHHHGTALLAAGVETALFHRYVFGHATATLFIEGRVAVTARRAPVPAALVAYGEDDAIALRRADIKGHFVWLEGAKRTGERTLT